MPAAYHLLCCFAVKCTDRKSDLISWLCESGIRATALDVKSFRLDDINDKSETASICNFSNNIVLRTRGIGV